MVEVDFDGEFRPLSELAHAVVEHATLRHAANLSLLQGAWGELTFGLPDRFTGFQPALSWVSSDRAEAILRVLPSPVGGEPANVFRHRGDGFELRYTPVGGSAERGTFRASRGLEHFARLLRTPFPAAALELMAADAGRRLAAPLSSQPVIDDLGLRLVYSELESAKEEREAAQERNDPVSAEQAAADVHRLQEQLKQLRGLGGRARRLRGGDDTAKAANAVAESLKRARQAIHKQMPKLAQHLKETVRQSHGHFVYTPPPGLQWEC